MPSAKSNPIAIEGPLRGQRIDPDRGPVHRVEQPLMAELTSKAGSAMEAVPADLYEYELRQIVVGGERVAFWAKHGKTYTFETLMRLVVETLDQVVP